MKWQKLGALLTAGLFVQEVPAVILTVADPVYWNTEAVKKVKFSYTRYRALGPELIPVYRQSARR